ncbi:MAG: replication initiator protein A [Agathobacter sp.]|nr:replication initiator protein A [Agathobacter sp.]
MKKRFNYFYGDQAQLFAFYRTPKAFFQGGEYKDISAEAKILYGILLDRVSLSAMDE